MRNIYLHRASLIRFSATILPSCSPVQVHVALAYVHCQSSNDCWSWSMPYGTVRSIPHRQAIRLQYGINARKTRSISLRHPKQSHHTCNEPHVLYFQLQVSSTRSTEIKWPMRGSVYQRLRWAALLRPSALFSPPGLIERPPFCQHLPPWWLDLQDIQKVKTPS